MDLSLEEDLWWTTQVQLPSWNGFQYSNRWSYGTLDPSRRSDGTVEIVFAPEGRDTSPLTDAEIALMQWLIDHEAIVCEAVLAALLAEYPKLQSLYDYSAQERQELMPDVRSASEFRTLIGLHTVNVHPILRTSTPYLGFEFGCTWDSEHGLGVLMHGTRMVEIGGADTAILLWIAERDDKARLA